MANFKSNFMHKMYIETYIGLLSKKILGHSQTFNKTDQINRVHFKNLEINLIHHASNFVLYWIDVVTMD